ncbi:MAG: hypothetical protein RR365_01930 [Bacteroides sp.]
MKQVKFLMVALAIMGMSLTSCMNGDSESTYDGTAYVTVLEYLGTPVLKVDNSDISLTVTNPDLLKQKDGSYVERALIYFKYQEGVVYDPNKKDYKVTIVQGQNIPVADFNLRPDTLKKSYKINDFALGKVLYNGGYLNTVARVSCNVYPEFTAYIDTAKIDKAKNMLPIILKFIKGGSENGGNYTIDAYNSFRLGNVHVSDPKIGLNVADSVLLSVTVEGTNEAALKKSIKYKFKY